MPDTPALNLYVEDENLDHLITYVIAEIRADMDSGDLEALYHFLSKMPRPDLIGFLGQARGDEALAAAVITPVEYDATF